MRYEGSLPIQDLYDVLSSQRRRYIISFLVVWDSDLNRSRLSDVIGAMENDLDDPMDVTTRQRRYAHQGLLQNHLPKLKRCNLLVEDNNMVETTMEAQYVIPFIVESEMEYAREIANTARSQ